MSDNTLISVCAIGETLLCKVKGSWEQCQKEINCNIKNNTIEKIKSENLYKKAYNEGMKNMNNSDFINALYLIQTYCDHKTEYGFIEEKYIKEGKEKFTLAIGREQGYTDPNASIALNRLCYGVEKKDIYYTAHSHPNICALSYFKGEYGYNDGGDLTAIKGNEKNMYVITSDGEIYFTTPDLAKHGLTYKTKYEVRIYGQVYLGKMSKNNKKLTVVTEKEQNDIDIKSEEMIFHNYNNPVLAFSDCKGKNSVIKDNCTAVIGKCKDCPYASQHCYDDHLSCSWVEEICRDCNDKVINNKCKKCHISECPYKKDNKRFTTPYYANCYLLACLKPCTKTPFPKCCIECIRDHAGGR